jgi:hypothetical protein
MRDGRVTEGRWIRAAIQLGVLGATLGVALDWLHVATGTTAYAHPVMLGLAWWVPLLFGGAAVAMGLARPLAERLTGRTRDRMTVELTAGAAAAGLAIFVLAYLATALLLLSPFVVAAIVSVLFLCAWGTSDGTSLGFWLAFLTAAIGTGVEVALAAAGAFTHHYQELAGVAPWLPPLYATGQMGVGAVGKRLVDADADFG